MSGRTGNAAHSSRQVALCLEEDSAARNDSRAQHPRSGQSEARTSRVKNSDETMRLRGFVAESVQDRLVGFTNGRQHAGRMLPSGIEIKSE